MSRARASAGWLVVRQGRSAHVLPAADLVEHEDSGTGCACGPSEQTCIGADGTAGLVVVHHSLDGRERREGTSR